jgi:hypothetical protein
MLVHAHAAGDAVHDDAETLLRHSCTFLLHYDNPRASCPRHGAAPFHSMPSNR